MVIQLPGGCRVIRAGNALLDSLSPGLDNSFFILRECVVTRSRRWIRLLPTVALLACVVGVARAQAVAESQAAIEAIEEAAQVTTRMEAERDELVQRLETVPAPERAELEASIAELSESLKASRQRFEELATGGADLSIFDQDPTEFDWRRDVLDTLRPMFDNLKRLTEKPRQVTDLRNRIETLASQRSVVAGVLTELETVLGTLDGAEIDAREDVETLLKQWRDRAELIEQEQELAKVRLARIQGDAAHWGQSVKAGLIGFAQGRGLTLLLAITAVALTWSALRLSAHLLSGTRFDPTRRSARPAWRFAGFVAQGLKLLAPFAMALMVFYLRGDVLLLALTAVAVFFCLLALKDLLPQYVAEARVLLNLASAREGERVLYNGLPWEIVSLNVHCILRNPMLFGSVRLPLSQLVGMVSRPIVSGESWFPCQPGDILLTPEGDIVEVGRQTTDQVELKALSGDVRMLHSPEVYGWGARNLSAGETFGVSCTFGLDYGLQKDALDRVPQDLKAGLERALSDAGIADQINGVLVELHSAGASSLDFIVYIGAKTTIARRYYFLQRLMQQACVRVCNENNWSIPFPQLTVHRAQ